MSEKHTNSKKSLDLISEEKKKRVVKKQGVVEPTLQEKKAQALDIFAEEGKKKQSTIIKKDTIASANEKAQEQTGSGEEFDESKILQFKTPISVSGLAEKMAVKPYLLIADLIKMKVFASNDYALDSDAVKKLCAIYGFKFEKEKRDKEKNKAEVISDSNTVKSVKNKNKKKPQKETNLKEKIVTRAPVVTFMGHVDHGKTSLLDYIRNTKIVAKEAGGITQHIAAYTIENKQGGVITFIDTPGHAVFSNMRSRGASVTDVIVIIIAADDGIKPQTIEAIEHAKKSGKEIIIAINKCDLPTADVVAVKTQLMEHGITVVDFGGEVEAVEISAKTGDGVEDLLDLIALQAEVLELQANSNATPEASIVEVFIQPGRGVVAKVIITNGTLKVGDVFLCGEFVGKVKGLIGSDGTAVKSALPGFTVDLIGFSDFPSVGSTLQVMKKEREAKKIAESRQQESREKRLGGASQNRLADLLSSINGEQEKAVLNVILKTDVQGSKEAIIQAIGEIESDKVECKFIAAGAGVITESDILMASSAEASIIGFNTKLEPKAVQAAKRDNVEVKLYSVIYELIDTIKDAMLGLLEPDLRESIIGHAEVKQLFGVLKGTAAGCYVVDGKVSRTAHARVLRNDVPVFDGKMSTLRRYKDEVKEVKAGTECGIRLGQFDEYEEGDIIECYILEKIAQTF